MTWNPLLFGLLASVGAVGADRLAGFPAVGIWLLVVGVLGAVMGRAKADRPKSPDAGLLLLGQAVVPVWHRQIEAARLYAENSMGELLSGFAMLSEHLDALASSPESGRSVQDELEGISVHLQSQDRVAQMLHAVTDDMQRMTSYLNGTDDPAARVPQQWLHRLEASYTMEDMKATHHNQEVVAPPSGVQYF